MFRLLGSTSVRLALVFAGLFVLAALALGALLWWETGAYLESETDAVIVADTNAIGDRLRDFGVPGAIASINERVAESAGEDEHAVYLLVDPTLAPLAGNLSAWPAAVAPPTGWYQAELVRGGHTYAARLFHVALPGGFQLLVGRDVQTRVVVRGLIVRALAWAAAAALALAIGGGIVVRRAALARIALVNRTTAAIVQGDLSRRLPAGAGADEFDALARTINDMLAQIELLVEGVRNATHAVAHDLRTPLAELRARLEDVGRRLPRAEGDGAQLHEEVQGAIADVDRLVAVFNALLRLAEIDSGARRAGFRAVELAPLAAQVAEIYGPLAEAKGLTFTVSAPPGIAVFGDPDMLAQAIANLVDNAIKYAPERAGGGRVALAVAREADGRAAIMVADDGPGIPEADRAKVVERFWRGDASRGSPGLGLGLAEVAAVAQLHGGTLELSDNRPGLMAVLRLPPGETSGRA